MADNYNNPKEAYKDTGPRYLKSFHIDTQTDSDGFIVPDPVEPYKRWSITASKTRYMFVQVVAQRFTDPTTYGETNRKPPEKLTGLQTTTSYSKVKLPDLMDSTIPCYKYIDETITTPSTTNNGAVVNKWMLYEHKVFTISPGVWEENVTMVAFSDFIWEPSSFRKRLLKNPDQITNSPVPAPATSSGGGTNPP